MGIEVASDGSHDKLPRSERGFSVPFTYMEAGPRTPGWATAPQPLKVGQAAVLASGGPSMTIVSIRDGQANCVWMVDGQCREREFPVEALRGRN